MRVCLRTGRKSNDMLPVKELLALFVAGGLGSLSRFGLSTYFVSVFGKGTPWGTAIVNLLGCLCFGAVAALFASRSHWDPRMKTIILTGFLGAFTTFSTYMFELHALLKSGEYGTACADFLLQNVGGLFAVLLGFWLAGALESC